MKFENKILALIFLVILSSCNGRLNTESKDSEVDLKSKTQRTPVIFDTDANNELDDQHALAYLLFNGDAFDVRGVTVNATSSGGQISEHFKEAERVMHLCAVKDSIPLYSGANNDFEAIRSSLTDSLFDGSEAVDFIIKESRVSRNKKLVLIPVGKLTNIALAIEKAPDIKKKVRIVWLGSNYPEPGEYNQENDLPALSYILGQDVSFEVVMVRYGKPSGSDAVRVTPEEIKMNMENKGPEVSPIGGRHGGSYTHFGDYSIDLFSQIDLYGEPPSRALFDMVAVAIVKNPNWGDKTKILTPSLNGENWELGVDSTRSIHIWENFQKNDILKDFYQTMDAPIIAKNTNYDEN